MNEKYLKQPLSSAALIELLKQRNLLIEDEAHAGRYLDSIGYYRLSGYMYHLQVPGKSHRFVTGTRFADIVNAYKFDKRLRAITMEYMGRIEVALRAKLTNYYSEAYGFFWYADAALFADKGLHGFILAEITAEFSNPKEWFLKTYRRNYGGESLPPSQMALEILSLGNLSRLYKALATDEVKMRIAAEFTQAPSTLETWFTWLTIVRNICAHHARLWNRILSAEQPVIPSRKAFKFSIPLPEDAKRTMYGVVALIDRLLKSFNPDNSFTAKVEALIREYRVDATRMGFPVEWERTAVWHH